MTGYKVFDLIIERRKKNKSDEIHMAVEFKLHDKVRYLGSLSSSDIYEIKDINGEEVIELLNDLSFIMNHYTIVDKQYIIFKGLIDIHKVYNDGDNRDELYNFQIIFNYSEKFKSVLEAEDYNCIDFTVEE